MTAPGMDGPAKVAGEDGFPGYGVLVGGVLLLNGSSKETSHAIVDKVNRALAPIVARAALAGRMAESLRHMKVCLPCGEERWEDCEGGREALKVLSEYDALLSTTEGRKDKNEMP